MQIEVTAQGPEAILTLSTEDEILPHITGMVNDHNRYVIPLFRNLFDTYVKLCSV